MNDICNSRLIGALDELELECGISEGGSKTKDGMGCGLWVQLGGINTGSIRDLGTFRRGQAGSMPPAGIQNIFDC